MSATMLSLITQATGEMGISIPTSVASSTQQDTVQELALLNACGNELMRDPDWQKSTFIHQFTTPYTTTTGNTTNGAYTVTGIPSTAGLDTNYQISGTGINNASYVQSVDSGTQVTMTQAAQATGTGVSLTFSQVKFDMPSGFDRVIDRTQWDKTQHWEMLGPCTPQQWEWLTSGYISTGPRVRWRILGGKFQIWPALSSSHLLGFEYQSVNWVYSAAAAAAGTAPDKQAFTVDTDQCIFPDRLMVLGLKKKYFEVKGFDATAFTRDYNEQKDISNSNDRAAATLSFAPKPGSTLITWNNIPDGNFPG